MKLKFKKQEFQEKAVKAVSDLFIGQQGNPSSFSVVSNIMGMDFRTTGYGNNLNLTMEEIEENMHEVQRTQMLPETDLTELRFNIEMETGTGKTFVYTKTIYELNKLYGFNKFVILVPSVAIREGVFKSLNTTKSYFEQEYLGQPMHFFIYNSQKITQVRDYATSNALEVMIVNIDSIKKLENLFNQESDKMEKTAREFLAECKPILIIDEPQSVDNTSKSREAITNLQPMCELRYSATHKEKVNTIYKLTPVDAYQMGIVKQICVANDSVLEDYNKPYIKLVEVGDKGRIYAKVELDIKQKDGSVKRKITTVYTNDDLEKITGRTIYSGYIINSIDCDEEWGNIEFSNTIRLDIDKSIGGFDEMSFKREEIKRTIEIHLEKEVRYLEKGIKVLSLFFIDQVARYRDYEQEDPKGIYAHLFEECYNELINLPKFKVVKDFYSQSADDVHAGYFSIDKKGKFKDTKGDTADDVSTYELIMKEKERLLSFDCPIRFIFSHSALKEGWDNPNVFQICTLIENKSDFTCRQKIGRGLRLCVNQNGDRVEDRKVNVLTVIAQESFAEFADKLQKEIEEETGIKFGILDIGMFVDVSYTDEETSEAKKMTYQDSADLLDFFRTKNYIEPKTNKIKDTLKNDLMNNTVDLPKKFETARQRILNQIQSVNRKVDIKQTRERIFVKRRNDLFIDDKFLALWDRLKQKAYYRINVRIDELLHRIINDVSNMEEIKKISILKETAKIDVKNEGVTFKKTWEGTADFGELAPLPDVVRILSENTGLPRANIGKIIIDSGRLQDFINNPQKYIEQVTKIINYHQHTMSIEGITYTKIEGQEYSLYEVFDLDESQDIISYADNSVEVKEEKTLYNYVVCDSQIEKDFAAALEQDDDVKFFFKIPERFKISTPVGSYNPDWAVYVKNENISKMYFVIETKGSKDRESLRNVEDIKIHCGQKCFEDLKELDFKWTNDWFKCKRNM